MIYRDPDWLRIMCVYLFEIRFGEMGRPGPTRLTYEAFIAYQYTPEVSGWQPPMDP